MLLTYNIADTAPYINWIYFFHAWGFQPRFATIANLHGCDSCGWRLSPKPTATRRPKPCSSSRRPSACSPAWKGCCR